MRGAHEAPVLGRRRSGPCLHACDGASPLRSVPQPSHRWTPPRRDHGRLLVAVLVVALLVVALAHVAAQRSGAAPAVLSAVLIITGLLAAAVLARHRDAWDVGGPSPRPTAAGLGEMGPDLRLVLASTADAIIGLDHLGKVSFANAAALTLLGREEHEVAGAVLHDLAHPPGRCVDADCALRAGVRRHCPLPDAVWRPDGRPVLVQGTVSATTHSSARAAAVVVMRDVTRERHAANALAESRQRFELAFEAAPIGMALITLEGRLLKVNPALSDLTGYEADRLEGDAVPKLLHPADRDTDAELRADVAAGFLDGYRVEQRLVTAEGDVRWVKVSTSLVRASSAEPAHLIAHIEDITSRRHAEEMLTHRALHDVLTGSANRTLLLDRLRHALACMSRTGRAVAMLAVDLDRFKRVNDRFGHDAADHVLVRTAERLRAVQRPGDTVGRIGADEFVIIRVDLTDGAEAERFAHRLQQLIAEPVRIAGHEITPSASVGVVVAERGDNAEALLRDAMAAVRHAKRRGRASVEVFDGALRERASARLHLETALGQAVADGQLSVEFQPIVDLTSGVVVGAEALTRWQHPTLGLLMPDAFMEIAEDTGLIVPIGVWVLDAACSHVARWRAATDAPAYVSVNLSAVQLGRSGLTALVERLLRHHRLPEDALRLEITESALVRAGAGSLPDLASLRARGVQIGLDDFGTGYASMSYLKQLPVDFLKIDRSFVAGVGADPHDTAIVKAMVALGRALGLKTIAEGVEGVEQSRRLRHLGCDYGQGYLYGRPQAVGDLILAGQRAGQGSPAA